MDLKLGPSHKMRMYKDKVLRNKGGPQKDAVTENWRRMQSEELQNLYSSPNILQGQEKLNGRSMRHQWGRGGVHTGFWWGNRREVTTWKT